MDGANIEIREAVGAENFFLFGLTAEEAQALLANGYNPMDYYHGQPELREVLNLIRDGFFSRGDTGLFRPLLDNLLYHDPYLVLADYAAYAECQRSVDAVYRDTERWTRMSILNSANSGRFSSDRSIRDYCSNIWRVERVPVEFTAEAELQAGLM
jgi:starch phosphorylase